MELNIDQIKELLPHREPFLLLDRVISLEPGVSSDAVKALSEDEFFFRGHFPDNPVMPGVMILEAMAQTAAVAVLALEENHGKTVLLAGVKNARFSKPVLPGDTLCLHSELKKMLGNAGSVRVLADVGEDLCATADLSFAVV